MRKNARDLSGLEPGSGNLDQRAHEYPNGIGLLDCTQDPAWIVDASKTAYLSFWRPLYYKLLGYHVAIIHLVRDPKAVIGSTLKGTNKQLENGMPRERILARQRTLLGWTFANMFATAYRATFSKSVLMHYEDLVSDPQRELRRIEALTSLDYAPVAALIASGSPLPGGHEIAGNRALRAGDMVFRLSDWRRHDEFRAGMKVLRCRCESVRFRDQRP